jgi:hypothetical protein
MKEKQRTIHKSMLGKEVDMHKLSMQNEMTVAIGNAKVNARGDELGPGGKIIRKREEVLRAAATRRPNESAPVSKPVDESIIKDIEDMDPEGDE